VEKVTLEVAKDVVKNMDEHVKDFTPFIRFYEFGDSSINLKVFFKVHKYGGQWPIIHDFIKKLLVRYNVEGINIPFPIRTLYHMNNIEMESK
jgi:small-conductance mechanosensitive channel